MIFRRATAEQKKAALEEWHDWFPLLPRRLTGTDEVAWLETIQRRGRCRVERNYDWWDETVWEYEYRAKAADPLDRFP